MVKLFFCNSLFNLVGLKQLFKPTLQFEDLLVIRTRAMMVSMQKSSRGRAGVAGTGGAQGWSAPGGLIAEPGQ